MRKEREEKVSGRLKRGPTFQFNLLSSFGVSLKFMCCPVWVSSKAPPPCLALTPTHRQGTKRPTSVWPYQCHRFVRQSFRVHEVSLATVRSIARPTVQQPVAVAATQGCEAEQIKLISLHTLSDLYLWSACVELFFFFFRPGVSRKKKNCSPGAILMCHISM